MAALVRCGPAQWYALLTAVTIKEVTTLIVLPRFVVVLLLSAGLSFQVSRQCIIVGSYNSLACAACVWSVRM